MSQIREDEPKHHVVFGRNVSDEVFNLKLNNGDVRQILLVNENQFEWCDFEITNLFVTETGLTGVILKYTFHHNYSSLIIKQEFKEQFLSMSWDMEIYPIATFK